MTEQSKRGGKREGSGRKSPFTKEEIKTVSFKVEKTREQELKDHCAPLIEKWRLEAEEKAKKNIDLFSQQ